MTDEAYEYILEITHNILYSNMTNTEFRLTNYTGYEVYTLSNKDWSLIHHVSRIVYYMCNPNAVEIVVKH